MAAAAAVPPAKQRVVLMPLGGAQMWEGFSKRCLPFWWFQWHATILGVRPSNDSCGGKSDFEVEGS